MGKWRLIMLKVVGIFLTITAVMVAVVTITGKMVNECAGCMKDWEG